MTTPKVLHLDDIAWQPHPVIPGIQTRVFQNAASLPEANVLLARVEPGGAIPWHVHEISGETAYVVAGAGVIQYAPTDDQTQSEESPLRAGAALTMPSGWWHTVINTGDVPLLLFAFHSPPIF